MLQRLVAHGLLVGEAYGEPEAVEAEEALEGHAGPPSDSAPHRGGPANACVELLCRGGELADDGVDVAVLRCILTAVCAPAFGVHGDALLRCVRAAYNVYLGSRSEVNASTAKATLTQALTFVFHRMEADTALVPPPVISVTDLLFPGGAREEGSALAAAVQVCRGEGAGEGGCAVRVA